MFIPFGASTINCEEICFYYLFGCFSGLSDDGLRLCFILLTSFGRPASKLIDRPRTAIVPKYKDGCLGSKKTINSSRRFLASWNCKCKPTSDSRRLTIPIPTSNGRSALNGNANGAHRARNPSRKSSVDLGFLPIPENRVRNAKNLGSDVSLEQNVTERNRTCRI